MIFLSCASSVYCGDGDNTQRGLLIKGFLVVNFVRFRPLGNLSALACDSHYSWRVSCYSDTGFPPCALSRKDHPHKDLKEYLDIWNKRMYLRPHSVRLDQKFDAHMILDWAYKAKKELPH